LHYGCTETALRDLVISLHALTPAARQKIIAVARCKR